MGGLVSGVGLISVGVAYFCRGGVFLVYFWGAAYFWEGLFLGGLFSCECCPYLDHFVGIVQNGKLPPQLAFTSLLHCHFLCTWSITTEPGNRKCNFGMIIVVPDSFPVQYLLTHPCVHLCLARV